MSNIGLFVINSLIHLRIGCLATMSGFAFLV